MERLQMDYEEFMEHAAATDSVVTREGDISQAVGWLYGRPDIHIATYYHADNTCALHCV